MSKVQEDTKRDGDLAFWLIVPAAVSVLDLVSKYYARVFIPAAGTVELIPGFLNLVLVENKGIAFGMFARGVPPKFIAIFAALFTLFFFFLLVEEVKRGDRLLCFSYSLILGGALGNLAERIVRGRVTDFLDLHYKTYHWPAFNLADVAITVGMLVFFLRPLLKRKSGG